MTDLDLDRLGDLWRQRPTAAELESLRRTAAAVQRKARWGLWIDNGAAIAVAAVVLVLVLSNPSFDTMLVGGAAIIVLLLSQARTRRLRAEELRGLTGSTQEMLEQSIVRAEATLKRTRFQLLAIVPSFALGIFVAAMSDRTGDDFSARIFLEPGLPLWLACAAVLVLALLAIQFTRSIRSTRGELNRLVALCDAFQAEGATTLNDAGETA